MEIPAKRLEDFLPPTTKIITDERGELEVLDKGIFGVRNADGKLQLVCGHAIASGGYCRRPAGVETTHPGMGYCLLHSRQKGDISVINTLGDIAESMPVGNMTIKDFIEMADEINDNDLKKVDSEIKLLYFLEMQLFKRMDQKSGMSISEETRLLRLIREIRETKLVRGKLENLTKVDAAYITWIIDKVAEIVQRFSPQNANLIINKILDTVQDPYNSAVQTGLNFDFTKGKVEITDVIND